MENFLYKYIYIFYILLIFSNVIVDAFYVRYITAVAELCFVGCVALINVSEVLSFLGSEFRDKHCLSLWRITDDMSHTR